MKPSPNREECTNTFHAASSWGGSLDRPIVHAITTLCSAAECISLDMPHSNHDSASSSDTFDLTGPMTSTAHYLNDAGVGRAISPNNQIPHQPSSLQNNAWKRRSLPNTGVYAEYIDRADLDELLALHAARSNRNSQTLISNHAPGNRTSFHEDQQLQYRDSAMAIARERTQRESPIIAELRTNVIVKDEFTLVTDLSQHLAQRYARSNSAIMVKVDHSACIALGGTFDPCYIMTITNISSQMGPAMNKRNAALIQSFMSDILSVPADRGIIKFHAMSEENLATNGTTIQGEIERQEKQQMENGSLTGRTSNASHRKSLPSMKRATPKLDTAAKRNSGLYPHDNLSNGALDHRSGSTTSLSPTVTITPANAFDNIILENETIRATLVPTNGMGKGENGLRMHPVTSNDIPNFKDSRLPNGRPKTISAETPSSSEPVRLASLPQRQSFSSPRTSRPPSFLKTDPTAHRSNSHTFPRSSGTQSAPGSRHSNTIPEDPGSLAAAAMTGSLPHRDSYYGSALDPRPSNGVLKKSSSGRSGGGGGAMKSAMTATPSLESTANTAKRRSTITATPKLPLSPPPPPIPETTTTSSSAKSLKVGKRKSFLAAFRRSATTA